MQERKVAQKIRITLLQMDRSNALRILHTKIYFMQQKWKHIQDAFPTE